MPGLTRQQIIDIQRALNAQGWGVEGESGEYVALEVDGIWGESTEAALIGFQEEHDLVPDGIPGPLTLAALLPNDARDPRVGEVPSGYDFSTREGTIEAIKAECRRQGLGLPAQIAYVLGTTQHETAGTFRPVEEGFYLGAKAREFQRTLRYWPYFGRGFVQLTWLRNYRKYGKILGVDLAGKPELALVPINALRILVDGFKTGAFTGAKLENYVREGKTDFRNARRCVNGLDKADLIARYAKAWLGML